MRGEKCFAINSGRFWKEKTEEKYGLQYNVLQGSHGFSMRYACFFSQMWNLFFPEPIWKALMGFTWRISWKGMAEVIIWIME